MAVDFKVQHNRSSEYRFAPEDIVIKPELNGRHDLPDIEWLISSILTQGQLQPVPIRSESGAPVLVAGFSRWRAVIEINKRKLAPVPLTLRCTYFKGSEFDGFIANIAENKARNDTTPLDDASNMAKLEKWGQTVEQIAAIYHQKPEWVKRRMELVNLEPEAQAAVKDGRLKPTAAAAIAKLSAAKQRTVVAKNGHVKLKDITEAAGKFVKPSVKQIQEILETSADDTTQSAAVRSFCRKLIFTITGVAVEAKDAA